jgi:molecular chaperone GrpE
MTDNAHQNTHSDENRNPEPKHNSHGEPSKKRVTGRIRNVIDERKKYESKLNELTEALQRERADITNIRRRHEEQMISLRDYAKADVVRQLLPGLDNLERALRHAPKDLAEHDYVKGVSGVVKQFEKVLKDIGVEKIKSIGKEFDPKYHEAVSMEDGEGSRHVISEELQAGYILGDEVIRHAMVKVKTEK